MLKKTSNMMCSVHSVSFSILSEICNLQRRTAHKRLKLINGMLLLSACLIYCSWGHYKFRRPSDLSRFPPFLRLVMDAVNKILPVDLTQWFLTPWMWLNLTRAGGFPIKQIICLSVLSEGEKWMAVLCTQIYFNWIWRHSFLTQG